MTFNDGIKAVVELLRDGPNTLDKAATILTIESIKRPEPSEANKLERIEKAIRGAMNGSEPFPRVSDLARAALKAMEEE